MDVEMLETLMGITILHGPSPSFDGPLGHDVPTMTREAERLMNPIVKMRAIGRDPPAW
jgi:hypothetical protein